MKLHHMLALALLAGSSVAEAGLLTWTTSFVPEGGGGRSGSGSAVVTFDDITHVLTYKGSFTGLSSPATQAHFHCCTAAPFTGTSGIAVDSPSLVGFPIGFTSGSFDAFVDLDDPDNFNTTFLSQSGGSTATATARVIAGFNTHTAYMNIHSQVFTGGEIRGFLVPEPASFALAALGLAALVTSAARRRQRSEGGGVSSAAA